MLSDSRCVYWGVAIHAVYTLGVAIQNNNIIVIFPMLN